MQMSYEEASKEIGKAVGESATVCQEPKTLEEEEDREEQEEGSRLRLQKGRISHGTVAANAGIVAFSGIEIWPTQLNIIIYLGD